MSNKTRVKRNIKFVPHDFCVLKSQKNAVCIPRKLNVQVNIRVKSQKARKITAFGKNHGIHGNCRNSRLPWFSVVLNDIISELLNMSRTRDNIADP